MPMLEWNSRHYVSLLLESYLGVLLDKSQKENKKSTNISMDGFLLSIPVNKAENSDN